MHFADTANDRNVCSCSNQKTLREKLSFLNLRTGERTRATLWANGRYIPEGMRAINHVLRDHRTGDRFAIDPDLFDILHQLQYRLRTNQEFHVVSAYRSPASNAMLTARSDGVAKASLRTFGKAIDIRLPGRKYPICTLPHCHYKWAGSVIIPRPILFIWIRGACAFGADKYKSINTCVSSNPESGANHR